MAHWATSLFRWLGRRPRSAFRGLQTRLGGPGWSGPGAAAEELQTEDAVYPGASSKGIVAGKTQDQDFRHPDVAAYLLGLTDKEAAKQLPLIRVVHCAFMEYRREGRVEKPPGSRPLRP